MKNLLKLLILFVFSTQSFISCTKSKINDQIVEQNKNAMFNEQNAKEWFYGDFLKANIKSISVNKDKKAPFWKNVEYRKNGGLEILEFPLNMSKPTFKVKKDNNVNKNDFIRVANGSISRVIFIRNQNNEVFIRQINYVPTLDYLKSMNFDIGKIFINSDIKKFSGDIEIKNWEGKTINIFKFLDGENKGKYIISNKGGSNTSNVVETCGIVETCEYTRDCDYICYSDNCTPTGECTPWVPTNNCTFSGEPCGPENDGDLCEFYGIGCDDSPPPPPPPPPEDEPAAASYNFVNVFAVKLSGSSGTNENWTVQKNVTINGMKFPTDRASNYYTTFAEDNNCVYQNNNPAYGGVYGNTNALAYCYLTGGSGNGCYSSSSLMENDKKFTNTSSTIAYYPNYHAPNGPVTPFSDSYSNTKLANAEFDL